MPLRKARNGITSLLTANSLSWRLCGLQLEQVRLSQAEAGRQAENDRDAREALWQKLQEANQKLSSVSRDALGREAELEQRLGMAEYGQQMAEVQSGELHVRLQQRGSMLQVRPASSPSFSAPLINKAMRCLCTPAVMCMHDWVLQFAE